MSIDDKQVHGHDRFVDMDCPHCGRHVTAELIELRTMSKTYQCPSCGREIHKDGLLKKLLPWIGFGLGAKW